MMPTLSSLVPPQAVMTTCGATSDDEVGTMTTLSFQLFKAREQSTSCDMKSSFVVVIAHTYLLCGKCKIVTDKAREIWPMS